MYLLLGPPLPIGLAGHEMVSWERDLVVIGGYTTGGTCSSSCYLLQSHNGILTWQEMSPKMMKAREWFAAIKIPEDIAKKLTS